MVIKGAYLKTIEPVWNMILKVVYIPDLSASNTKIIDRIQIVITCTFSRESLQNLF